MAGDFCDSFFCSTFFCTTTQIVETGTGIPGGGQYLESILIRRRIPRFTRYLRCIIEHRYWIRNRVDWTFNMRYLEMSSIRSIIPKEFRYELKSNIPQIYKSWSNIITKIPTNPHPSLKKKFANILKAWSEWE